MGSRRRSFYPRPQLTPFRSFLVTYAPHPSFSALSAQNRAFAPRNSGVLAAPPGQAAFFLPTPKTSSDSSASPNLGYDVVSGPAVGLGIMETDFFPADGYQVDGATVAPGSVSSDTSEKKSAVASKGKGQGRAKSVTIKNKSLLQDDEASSSPRPKTTRRGVHAGTPPEGPFFGSTTLTLIPLLDETGMPARLEVLAECHRAFFKEEDEGCWLIYRRNYVSLYS